MSFDSNYQNQSDFNPRSREGSDKSRVTGRSISVRFQSTLPRGERLCLFLLILLKATFQSTLPRGERHEVARKKRWLLYFNPRSREGSDVLKKHLHEEVCISIHAPARGATFDNPFLDPEFVISIHAPARGATQQNMGITGTTAKISIHAPARGATANITNFH